MASTSSELDLFSDCSSLSSPKNDSGRHERHSMEVEYAEDGENADSGIRENADSGIHVFRIGFI